MRFEADSVTFKMGFMANHLCIFFLFTSGVDFWRSGFPAEWISGGVDFFGRKCSGVILDPLLNIYIYNGKSGSRKSTPRGQHSGPC